MPILDAMLAEQKAGTASWTPSKMIARLGAELDDDASICSWAARHGVPIYCPALTDGSIGDMLFFHTYKNPGLILDIVADVRSVNDEALKAAPRRTGVLILGGGLPKHHACNANLMKNGADYAVYVSTAQEFDGSDSGARPDEAVSWGKIRADARPALVGRLDGRNPKNGAASQSCSDTVGGRRPGARPDPPHAPPGRPRAAPAQNQSKVQLQQPVQAGPRQ